MEGMYDPDLGISKLTGTFGERSWGFGGCMTVSPFMPRYSGWIGCQITLPQVGQGSSLKQWGALISCSRSVAALLRLLEFATAGAHPGDAQLLTVKLVEPAEPSLDYGVFAEVSAGAADRLQNGPHGALVQSIVEAQRHAWWTMWPQYLRRPGPHHFGAKIRDNGKVFTAIPGNACGLDSDWVGREPGRGFSISSHNVDNPVQQLVLFATLCQLYDLLMTL